MFYDIYPKWNNEHYRFVVELTSTEKLKKYFLFRNHGGKSKEAILSTSIYLIFVNNGIVSKESYARVSECLLTAIEISSEEVLAITASSFLKCNLNNKRIEKICQHKFKLTGNEDEDKNSFEGMCLLSATRKDFDCAREFLNTLLHSKLPPVLNEIVINYLRSY